MARIRHPWAIAIATTLGIFTASVAAADSKRGVGYIDADDHESDYALLLSDKSPVNWYFTWSPVAAPSDIFPDGAQDRLEFVPALPGIDNIDDDIEAAKNLPDSSKHLLTFNEPDGTTSSGGSSIDPKDAAQAYIDQVVPLRDQFQISHPAVTGSSRGLDWLNDFNSSCWDIDSDNGCPADFVAVHWYGDYLGLTTWLDQITGWYNESMSGIDGDLKVWVTELGLAQADEDTTFAMMNQTLPYLDSLSYVEKYSWFGVFRPKEANEWTGDNIALLENDGGLSKLGAYYLGGQDNGFEEGQTGGESGSSGLRTSISIFWLTVLTACLWVI
ncbi:glycosyl hydrolase catalytic core-domain-containing protein [Xylariaceae sp. FL1019]|nr:glycosyl hydrolase catalytic core-domain-containing protein [Xylariaceae sp. FL1019]